LTSGIPKRQLDLFAVDLDIGNVVLKHGRNVDLEYRQPDFSCMILDAREYERTSGNIPLEKTMRLYRRKFEISCPMHR
jgi:hypothetical protein